MFFSKQGIVKTGLMQGMTEVHSHLLPGVDDGVQTWDESLAALAFLQQTGIARIYLTPHIMEDLTENTPEALLSQYKQLLKRCPPEIELRLAAEYMLDAGFAAKLKKGLLTMSNKHVLVETSYLSPPPDLDGMLYSLTLESYAPIIAHPERYIYMHAKDYSRLKKKGYKFQLNLFSIAGAYGLNVEKKANVLLKQGLYDFVGSDVHRLSSYRDNLHHLRLSRSQLRLITDLFNNNHSLW
jgi:tyrosine-protein phosphatase YwqE